MEKVSLGKSRVAVSPLGLGALAWGRGNRHYGGTAGPSAEKEMFDTSLAGGVNFFDTAERYGHGASEASLGELSRGTDAVIASKFYNPPLRTARVLPSALEGSLARLGRTSVDLYQIHLAPPFMSIPRLMRRLADAVDAGKARAVGVSNFSEPQMRRAHEELAQHGIPLASNQVQYSLLHRDPETSGVLRACRELGVTLIAFGPLAAGALSGKYSPEHRPPDWRRRTVLSFYRGKHLRTLSRVLPVLAEIGRRHDTTHAQVALRWLLQQPNVVPIPGARNAQQARQNAGALTFSLSTQEMDALSDASAPGA